MAKVASQGGVKNYLGKQPQVKAPKYWQSSPDHPTTELAYITQKEKDLLVKKDLHGSLKGGVNRGPSGIISLNGWGSSDASQNRAGSDISAGMDKSGSDAGWADTKTAHMKGPTGKSPAELSLLASKKGSTTVMPGTTGGKTSSSNPFKSVFDFGKKYIRNRKKGIYNLVGNNPKNELEFLASLQITDPAKYNSLPQNLKDLLDDTRIGLNKIADDGSFKDAPKFSYDDFESLTQFDDGAFAKYALDRGSPGLSVAGDMSKVGMKSVRKDQFGNPVKDMFGNTLFDYTDTTGRGEGEGQNLLPLNYGAYGAGAAPVEEETQTFEFDSSRFGPGGDAADVTRASYIFNQGGRVPRNMGGIMNVVPRQGYFLGKIVKGVKSAIGSVADAAGKVLKSPLGKAALAAGAFYYGGGGRMPFTEAFKSKGFGGFSLTGPGSFFSKANPLLFTNEKFNPLKLAGLVTLGGAAMGPAKQDPSLMTDRGGKMPDFITGGTGTPAELRANIENAKIEAAGDPVKLASLNQKYNNMLFSILPYENYGNYAQGGRIRAEEGGLMNLGGMEKDYRAEGGFVPIGKEEKADDVPARLSVNEFVFTADAVRNAGGGDIDRGAEVMENMMKNLENGGRVSEESQGNTGAQDMFSVSERIGEVI